MPVDFSTSSVRAHPAVSTIHRAPSHARVLNHMRHLCASQPSAMGRARQRGYPRRAVSVTGLPGPGETYAGSIWAHIRHPLDLPRLVACERNPAHKQQQSRSNTYNVHMISDISDQPQQRGRPRYMLTRSQCAHTAGSWRYKGGSAAHMHVGSGRALAEHITTTGRARLCMGCPPAHTLHVACRGRSMLARLLCVVPRR